MTNRRNIYLCIWPCSDRFMLAKNLNKPAAGSDDDKLNDDNCLLHSQNILVKGLPQLELGTMS